MKIAVFAFTRRGAETAERLKAALAGEELRLYAAEKYLREGFEPLEPSEPDFYGRVFRRTDAMIFVGACGIAVRCVAPWVTDKRTDPAVLAVGEGGRFVIPLLSGHIGGGNALARRLAAALDAVPVITTATDLNGRFSADEWASRRGYAIGDMTAAKEVSAAILERDIPIRSDFPIVSELPSGVVPGSGGELGIYITCGNAEPFDRTLRLIPRVLRVGIGCRRGTNAERIRDTVDAVLRENGLDALAVGCAASIDLKSDEQGLLAFCRERGWPVRFYAAEELRRLEGDFTGSAFVSSVTGVDSVCERAAMMGAERLVVRKTAADGVTVAIAAESWEVSFE